MTASECRVMNTPAKVQRCIKTVECLSFSVLGTPSSQQINSDSKKSTFLHKKSLVDQEIFMCNYGHQEIEGMDFIFNNILN